MKHPCGIYLFRGTRVSPAVHANRRRGPNASNGALAASAIAIALFPDLHTPPEQLVERVVTVALLCILFDVGMHLGWSRFRRSAAPIGPRRCPGTGR